MPNYRSESYDFDAEKVMSMSRDKAISLLGEENAQIVREGLKNGTLDYREFQRICESAFPYPQQAHLVRNVIFNQLSKSEGFNMFESNKEKQAEYEKITYWKEKAEKGELTREDLKGLCDKVYGENSELSIKIQQELIAHGRIKEETQKSPRQEHNPNVNQGKKNWELSPEEKSKVQAQTAAVAQQHNENMSQQKQQQSQDFENNQQQNPQMTQKGNLYPQMPTNMNMGGMER